MPAVTAPVAAARVLDTPRRVDWAAVLAGAVAASAISFVLLAFGAAVGLSATSAWPDRGMSVTVAAILMGLWIALVQAGSFAAGGYLAGRLRSGAIDSMRTEREFGDGAHGFLVWGVGVLIGAALAGGAIAGATRTAVESGAMVAAGATGGMVAGAAQRGGEIAVTPADYATDYLLRPGPGAPPAGATVAPAPRAEITRALLAAIRDGSLPPRDRTWLAQVVSQRTGLPPAEAERRVDEAYAEAKAAEAKVRAAADRARKAGALAGFLTAAALAVGCVAACVGAGTGARHRESGSAARLFGARLW